VQNRLRIECDGGSSHYGAFNNTACPKGGGTAESPQDVLRLGSVLQYERGVFSGNHGAESLEEKHGVRFIGTVESDLSAEGEFDCAGGTVGSRPA
jgi:hypothetical protein